MTNSRAINEARSEFEAAKARSEQLGQLVTNLKVEVQNVEANLNKIQEEIRIEECGLASERDSDAD